MTKRYRNPFGHDEDGNPNAALTVLQDIADSLQTIAARDGRPEREAPADDGARVAARMGGLEAQLRQTDRERLEHYHALSELQQKLATFRAWLEERSAWAHTNDIEYGAVGLACEALARLDGDCDRARSYAATLAEAARK